MRWWMLAIACAGCPAVETTPEPEVPELPPAPVGELPPSNCPRGAAPPITWCHEYRDGRSIATASQFSEGPLYIQDWTNFTAGAQGHVETVYGDGFPIERHETGTFAGRMTTICSADGRVSIEHAPYAAIRVYYDTTDRRRSSEWDTDHDGVFEDRTFYTYDAAGRLARDVHDTGPGTPVDRVFAYEYDEAGRLITATTDREADGVIDMTTTHTWDPQDRELVAETYEHGELVERWLWTYDGPREISTEIEGEYRWTNSHDERDLVIGVEFRDLVTDHVDAVTMQRYDVFDRMIESVEDDGVDGTIDQRVTWEYCP